MAGEPIAVANLRGDGDEADDDGELNIIARLVSDDKKTAELRRPKVRTSIEKKKQKANEPVEEASIIIVDDDDGDNCGGGGGVIRVASNIDCCCC